MMKIYGDMISGNCLKVKYTADMLGIPYEWMAMDVLKGDSRTPDYLAKNPQGQVPMIELDDGRTLAQSNAIIRYLARGSRLLPDDAYAAAKVDEWLFWEQYSHEPYIAVCRFHHQYLGKPLGELDDWRVERGNAALDLMEDALEGKDWLTESGFTLVDIALLAYTQFAHEGGFSLEDRENVKAWIDRARAEIGIA